MITEQEKIIKKFESLSLNYHKMSLLFNELAGSLKIKNKELGIHNPKKFREYLKSLNLDVEKIKNISLTDLKIKDLKGGLKE